MSFRRVFPYFATLAIVLGIALVFALRPTPFIGTTPDAVASSFSRGAGGAVETATCEETGDETWTCTSSNHSGGQVREFDLEINGFGCWTATPTSGRSQIGIPSTLSGCITLWDH